jgi:hypothetical protein
MTWVIIGLILLAAFGPVLWLVPSKRDRHLSALREQARREGLVVELRRLPKLNPSPEERVTAGGRVKEPVVECTAYTHTLTRRLAWLPSWRLIREEGYPQPLPGWVFDPDLKAGGAAFDASLEILDELFAGLPSDVIGVQLSARSLTLYWLESAAARRDTVTSLSALVKAAQDRLFAVDDRFQPMSGDEDS